MRTRLQVVTHVAEVNIMLKSTVQEVLIRCLPVGQDNQVQGLQRAWSWSSQKVFNLFESAASSAKHGARAVYVLPASGVILRRFKRAAPTLERRLLGVYAVGLVAFLPNMVTGWWSWGTWGHSWFSNPFNRTWRTFAPKGVELCHRLL